MNEIKTKALVIKQTDYRENDKLITLFSVEKGKITAVLKGCNKPNAKLKFAGQLFCLADFNLVQTGDFYQVTTASEVENFFEISKDFSHLSVGCAIFEILDVVLNKEEPNVNLLVYTLRALELLTFDNSKPDELIVLLKFFLIAFENAGYELSFSKCQECGMDLHTNYFLNLETGEMVCSGCKTENSIRFSHAEFSVLRILDQTELDRIGSVKAKHEILKSLIYVLGQNFKARFSKEIKSLKNI